METPCGFNGARWTEVSFGVRRTVRNRIWITTGHRSGHSLFSLCKSSDNVPYPTSGERALAPTTGEHGSGRRFVPSRQ